MRLANRAPVIALKHCAFTFRLEGATASMWIVSRLLTLAFDRKEKMKGLAAALLFLSALGAITTALAGNGTSINPNSADVLTIAVYGDSPYGTTPTDTAEFAATPSFIASINADPKVRLVVHVGDIHSGKQLCTEVYDRSIYDLWTAFKNPLVYTPGDNEWTDCHKVAEGGGAYNTTTHRIDYVLDTNGNFVDYAGGDPIANLALVRSIFFQNPGYTLGGRKKQVYSQAEHFDTIGHPSDGKYVENVIWEQSKVVFVTINLPGGSNNDNDIWYGAPTMSAVQAAEIAERTGADLRWLDQAFAVAQADDDINGVVIIAQADMWDPEKAPRIRRPMSHSSGASRITRPHLGNPF
jgi:hypothetical protein